MAARTTAQSSAVWQIGPSLSIVQLRAMAPCRLTRPYVGRSPGRPRNPDGARMEPAVRDPMARGTRPAATAAPEPLDDPPHHDFLSHGFRPGPVNEALACLYPIPPAISTMASFAAST